ncbi:unnamed protein product [Angiostrongylus costaricensis]|uniref:Rho-GAP domain-containing protein n=1 Tax=Angiostrongylus costaricensis TaxID=334426 RepID=A0A158PEW8_ANGCS|nr:unnamed protein product [Angiostrongylus costaricensis]
MTVVASYGMVLCGNSSDDLHQRYRGRIEKVKFGVPINEAFAHDIPATLLVLLLKVNKEGPLKKDIWRAPGNQAQVRKLSHIMQHGRLVNIANFSVYTAASVIKVNLSSKEFLQYTPSGDWCSTLGNVKQIFENLIFCSLPVPSQHLLVLLFGTFRMVADCSETYGTKMNTDAIAISVAPSLFHSCIHDGRQVKVEDVQRFKLASEVVKNIIASFGHINLFPRECYEFYARITGRTLRVDENWLFSFQYPSSVASSAAFSAMAARCAGAYSLAALHLEVSAFEPSEVIVRLVVHGMHRTFSLNRHPLAHTTDHPKRPNLGSTIGVGVNEFVDLKQSVSCDF